MKRMNKERTNINILNSRPHIKYIYVTTNVRRNYLNVADPARRIKATFFARSHVVEDDSIVPGYRRLYI